MEKPNEVVIKRETLQKVVDYLETQPYREVVNLISEVVQNHRPLKEFEGQPGAREEAEDCLPVG